MMLPDGIEKILRQTRQDQDPILKDMEEYATNNEFPIIGPDVGVLLELLSRIKNAKNIFEFGSGFGYSAYWFLNGMANDGQITLTEIDESNLNLAKEYFNRSGDIGRIQFEHGDAVDIAVRYKKPIDIVLIDFEKSRYPEALHAIEGELKSNSVVVADNILKGPADYSEVLNYLSSSTEDKFDPDVEGVGEYLKIATGERFCTSIVPIGKGVSLTVKS